MLSTIPSNPLYSLSSIPSSPQPPLPSTLQNYKTQTPPPLPTSVLCLSSSALCFSLSTPMQIATHLHHRPPISECNTTQWAICTKCDHHLYAFEIGHQTLNRMHPRLDMLIQTYIIQHMSTRGHTCRSIHFV